MSFRVLVSNESDDAVGATILAELPNVDVVTYDPATLRLDDVHRSAEILVPPYRGSHRPIPLLEQLSSLQMVQLLSAGVDEWMPHVPSAITLASARGAHAGPVSEWVLSAILAQFRQWPALVRFQDSGIWAHRRFHADTLAGKRALVIGAGAIGMAVARRLQAFGTVSTLVASAARGDVHGADEIPGLISGHDIVIVTAPLNERTAKMIDAHFLAAMDDGGLLVNAGRGQIVDTDALMVELGSGRLRAALDVTDPEPLPADHPLWKLPGVIISPHSARTVPGTNELCYQVAAQQIASFMKGEVPANAVRR